MSITEQEVMKWIKDDEWMMDILQIVQKLDLPDWWICAGFVRSKIWDKVHHFSVRTPLPDIDVIYYDANNIEEEEEKQLEQKLKQLHSLLPWSVKNQARMHTLNDFPPYTSAVDGIAHFTETATALGVKLDEDGSLVFAAPWGITDTVSLKVRPTPLYEKPDKRNIYENRVIKKAWQNHWTRLEILGIEESLL
ncbi:nucleotidyltransferase family protein [Niallia circulans]|uniref:Nucleotidyltransferase family protein n=1 Tax=Niallia circulans TaxID=1397 RepID=A0A553SLS0_NIACI|nr:nucleotidyltransferase family protein [Niallia circulans]TRZ37936.1 nucleotidyltransferase family protein [Niallia circulans]